MGATCGRCRFSLGSTPRSSGLGRRKREGVATQFYDLRTMYIAPLCGSTDLTAKVWVWSLGTILGMYWAPKTTRPVGRLPFIVSYVLILLKTCSILHLKTHTHKHTSKHTTWYFITSQTLAFIYHASYDISSEQAKKNHRRGNKYK